MIVRTSSSRPVSANERFKSKSGDLLSIGVIAAVITHFGLFALCPDVDVAEVRSPIAISIVLERPPAVVLPPPPRQIDRPRVPRVAAAVLDEEPYPYRFIPPGEFPHRDRLPPPRPGARADDEPVFIPRDQEPVLQNRSRLLRELQQRYPPMLREAGIGGTVGLYLFVSRSGEVTRTVLQLSSGQVALDRAALEVAREAEFSPAHNRNHPVGVWIQVPFEFGVH